MSERSKGHCLYLYAIVDAGEALPPQPAGPYTELGLNGGGVYGLTEGPVAGIVSDVTSGKFRPQRRHLAAHHEVLKTLFRDGRTVLPMSFGIVAEDRAAFRRLVALNEEVFCEELQRVRGKVEMGLRVRWEVPNVFQYVVDTHPELRQLREKLFRGGREPTHDEKIALGRRFEQFLEDDRARHTRTVREVLDPVCSEIRQNDPGKENEVINLACLVDRGAEDAYETAVFEAARRFDDNYSFDYSGPWPPHNFVDADLEI
ncbi:MAG: GvpL/GvpF family gas vesicle protein [Planctomycetota bacterium]